MAEKKLSEELRHCLETEQCGSCECWETETTLICKGLLQKAYEAVKRYEEMEEQRKLLKLPCAVGDKVYKIWSCGKNGKTIAEFIVSHIDIDCLPDIEFSYRKENGHGNYYFSKIEDIGKTVFLTKSAAEQALKEMEGKNGN